jgi:hypothetical protein
VPLKYSVSVTTRLLVEPATGAIVSLDSIDQTLNATPDFAGFAQLAAILSTPRLADLPAVQSATSALEGIAALPPVVVFTMSYGQTPESVADFAAYAESKADEIALVERWIPIALAVLGAIALVAAAVMSRRQRRTPPAMPVVAEAEVPTPPRPTAHV